MEIKGYLHNARLSHEYKDIAPVRVTILRQYKSTNGDRYQLRIEEEFTLGNSVVEVGNKFGVPTYAVEPDDPEAVDHTGQKRIDRIAGDILKEIDV